MATVLLLLYLVAVLLLKPFTQKGTDRLRQLTLMELMQYVSFTLSSYSPFLAFSVSSLLHSFVDDV